MITNITASGYRLLDDFEADLGQLTVIIGANASGKSTLIDCLQLITQLMDWPLKQAMEWHGGFWSLPNASAKSQQVACSLTLLKSKQHPVWGKIPLEDDHAYTYEILLTSDAYGQAIPTYECLRNTKPLGDHREPLKFIESTGDRSLIFDPKQRKLVSFDAGLPQVSLPGSGGPATADAASQKLDQVWKQEQTLRLAQMRFYNEYPVPSWIRTLLANNAFYPGFDVGRFAPLRTQPAEIRPETTLYANGANLGTVLHEMLTRYEYRPSAEELRDCLKTAYPWFDDITAETAYGTPPKVLARLREISVARPMELWDLSDGMLRFLCLAVALLNPLPPPLVAIDEPEIGLHPRLLPIVADLIKVCAERTQVLITTHSPDLLNRFNLEDVAVLARDTSRAVWRRPSSQSSLRKMLESVGGDRLGDLHRSGELEAVQ